MGEASVRFSDLAVAVGVNVKSAQRWVYEGRVPQKRQVAVRVGQVLGTDPAWLWPKLGPRLRTPDLIHLYDQIGEVPKALWLRLAKSALERITIASDTTPVFPSETLAEVLQGAAAGGVEVEICLGASHRPMWIPGIEIRRSWQPDMISLFRFDDSMLVWLNRGGPGMDRLGPVLHLTRSDDNGLFDAYAFVLRTLWTQSSPDLLYGRRS